MLSIGSIVWLNEDNIAKGVKSAGKTIDKWTKSASNVAGKAIEASFSSWGKVI